MSAASQIEKIIEGRHTCHRYAPSKIEDKLLKRGLELALTAPNHKFTFPWQFVICGEKTRQKFYEQAKLKAEKKAQAAGEDFSLIEKKLQEKMLNPASLVVFSRKIHADPKMAHEDYATVACSIQNFTLYLEEHGFKSKWSTGAITTSPETYETLGLDPESEVIDGFIWIGKPLVKDPPRRRPSLDEVLKELD